MVENHLRESGYSDDSEANPNSKSVSQAHVGEGYSAKIPSAEMQRRFNTPTDSKFLQNDDATDPVMSNGRDAKCRGGVSAVRQRHRTNLSHKRSQRMQVVGVLWSCCFCQRDTAPGTVLAHCLQ